MKKRFLSILAALCLCLTLLPATAMADDNNLEPPPNTISSWGALQAQLEDPTEEVIDATLTSDIEWGGSSLTIPERKNVTIDLNGHSIDAQSQGTVIKVLGTLTINNSGADNGARGAGPVTGQITNGVATSVSPAGGIYIASVVK